MRRLLLSLLLVPLTACDLLLGPGNTVSGTWGGDDYIYTFTVDLVQRGTDVTGTGEVETVYGVAEFTVAGSYDSPELEVTLQNLTLGNAVFTGTRYGATITGVLNGAGFTDYPLTLTKQVR